MASLDSGKEAAETRREVRLRLNGREGTFRPVLYATRRKPAQEVSPHMSCWLPKLVEARSPSYCYVFCTKATNILFWKSWSSPKLTWSNPFPLAWNLHLLSGQKTPGISLTAISYVSPTSTQQFLLSKFYFLLDSWAPGFSLFFFSLSIKLTTSFHTTDLIIFHLAKSQLHILDSCKLLSLQHCLFLTTFFSSSRWIRAVQHPLPSSPHNSKLCSPELPAKHSLWKTWITLPRALFWACWIQ